MTKTPERVAMYLRLSQQKKTDGKGDTTKTDDSIDGQRDLCRKWLEDNGLGDAIVTEYVEVKSAFKRTSPRPVYERMVGDLKAGLVDRIVTRHVDRLLRTMVDLEELVVIVEETKAPINTVWAGHFDLSTPAGRQTARILASVAQGESDTKSERIRATLARRKADGLSIGAPRAFGFKAGSGNRVVDPDEKKIVKKAAKDFIKGKTLATLTREWEAAEIKTPQGAPHWRPSAIKKILERQMNAEFGILTAEELAAVRGVLADPTRRNKGKRGPAPRSLLSGLLTCWKCDGELIGNAVTGGQLTYSCRDRHVSIARDAIDALAVTAMVRFYMEANAADLTDDAADRAALTALQASQGDLETERAETVAMMREGTLRPTEARDILKGITEREQHLQQQVDAMTHRVASAAMLARPVMEAGRVSINRAARIKKNFLNQHIDLQRRLIGDVWKITIRPVQAGLPQSVTFEGETYREEGLTPQRKQERRALFECLRKPALSFDPITEDLENFSPPENFSD